MKFFTHDEHVRAAYMGCVVLGRFLFLCWWISYVRCIHMDYCSIHNLGIMYNIHVILC